MPRASSNVPIYPFEYPGQVTGAAEKTGLHSGKFQTCLEARGRLRHHRHDHFEIFWLPHAQGTHRNDFHAYPIKRGTFIFVSPGQIHGWTVPATTTGQTISFTRDFFRADPEAERLLFDLPFFYPAHCSPVIYVPKAERPGFEAQVTRIANEFTSGLTSRAIMLRSSLLILLVEAQRLYARINRNSVPARPRARLQLARRFQFLLEENFAKPGGAARYAQLLGVSAGHLRERVVEQTGRTVGVLINERRRLEARRLLAHTEMTVAEIAYRVGFEDASYFGRVFRRNEKISPGLFRANFLSPS